MEAQALAHQVTSHYEKVVREVVARHAKMREEPLMLAIRYKLDDPKDVYLLEVIKDFPGGPDDPPFTAEFGSTPEFPILGHFHLTLVSPAQLRSAITRSEPIVEALRHDGILIFPRRPDSKVKPLLRGLSIAA